MFACHGLSLLDKKFPEEDMTPDSRLKEIRDLKKALSRKEVSLPKQISDMLHAPTSTGEP